MSAMRIVLMAIIFYGGCYVGYQWAQFEVVSGMRASLEAAQKEGAFTCVEK